MGHAGPSSYKTYSTVSAMRGPRTCFGIPAHGSGGIATEIVVGGNQVSRKACDTKSSSDERVVARVWQWREESGRNINRQLRRLGSPDWAPGSAHYGYGLGAAGVRRVFVQLIRKALISATSGSQLGTGNAYGDLGSRVETARPRVRCAYPLPHRGNAGPANRLAKTRPENAARRHRVAVHPNDPRLPICRKTVRLPLIDVSCRS